jgi:hypothetical protein
MLKNVVEIELIGSGDAYDRSVRDATMRILCVVHASAAAVLEATIADVDDGTVLYCVTASIVAI